MLYKKKMLDRKILPQSTRRWSKFRVNIKFVFFQKSKILSYIEYLHHQLSPMPKSPFWPLTFLSLALLETKACLALGLVSLTTFLSSPLSFFEVFLVTLGFGTGFDGVSCFLGFVVVLVSVLDAGELNLKLPPEFFLSWLCPILAAVILGTLVERSNLVGQHWKGRYSWGT